MDFQLDEKYLKIQEVARNFAENELKPGVIERDAKSEFPVDLYKKMGELGLIGLPYEEKYGGSGMDYLAYALAVVEISKVDASVGIAYSVSTSLYGGSVMNSDATEEQKLKFLPDVLSGKSFGAFGLTEETAGSDVSGATTTAVKDGDEYIINGKKIFTTNGPLADYLAVYALTQPELKGKGMSCFIVKKDTPGVRIGKVEDKMGIRSAQVSEVFYENVRVPAENKITEDGNGFKLSMGTLDCGRIGVAAQGLGIAKGAFEITKNYLKEREQFGRPLSKNQYLQFRMAELEMIIDQAELMLYKAATDKDQGRPYSVSAAKAKYLCTNAAMTVTTDAVQFLGGNGYMKDYHVERMMRDAKITQIYEGTNEIQKMIVSGPIFR